MIEYSGLFSFVRWRGSVLPKALQWAVPCTCLVFAYDLLLRTLFPDHDKELEQPSTTETAAIGLFTSIIGFLIVFRANLAYGRFWEGVTLVERACSVWLNGVSNLVAFCNSGVEKQVEVAAFQHLLTRLMSLLLSISLSDVSRMSIGTFSTLNLDGIDPESLEYLQRTQSKQKVVLQWVQRLVVEKERDGVVDVPAPILSRVFQEFSLGIVNFIEARKLTSVPFPFIFAQLVHVLLCVFSAFLMPLSCAWYVQVHKAAALTFLVVFGFMSIHYISLEIEQPFGGDLNDLPLADINFDFNQELMTLLEQEAQQTPVFVKSTDEIKEHVTTCKRIAEERMTTTRTSLPWDSTEFDRKSEKRPSMISSRGMMSRWHLFKSPFNLSSCRPHHDEELPPAVGFQRRAASSMSSFDRLSRVSSAHLSENSSTDIAHSLPTLTVQCQEECSVRDANHTIMSEEQQLAQHKLGMMSMPRWQSAQASTFAPSPQRVSIVSFPMACSEEIADCEVGEDEIGSSCCPSSDWRHNLAAVAGTQPPRLQEDLDAAEQVGQEVGGGRASCAGRAGASNGVECEAGSLASPQPQHLKCQHI